MARWTGPGDARERFFGALKQGPADRKGYLLDQERVAVTLAWLHTFSLAEMEHNGLCQCKYGSVSPDEVMKEAWRVKKVHQKHNCMAVSRTDICMVFPLDLGSVI